MKKQLETIYNEHREKAMEAMDEDLVINKDYALFLMLETYEKVWKYLFKEDQLYRIVSVWNGSETNPANDEKHLEEAFNKECYHLRKITRRISFYNLCVRFSEIINIAETLMQNADRIEEMEEERRQKEQEQKGEDTMTIKEAFEKAQEEQVQGCEYDYYAEYVAETEKAKACERARLWGEYQKPESSWKKIKEKLERSAEDGNNMDSSDSDFRDLDKWTHCGDCCNF